MKKSSSVVHMVQEEDQGQPLKFCEQLCGKGVTSMTPQTPNSSSEFCAGFEAQGRLPHAVLSKQIPLMLRFGRIFEQIQQDGAVSFLASEAAAADLDEPVQLKMVAIDVLACAGLRSLGKPEFVQLCVERSSW